MRPHPDDELAFLLNWLFEEALPLWSTRGVDETRGGFVERLTPDGAPTEEPRRARLVGRQVYVFATAERLGWPGPARQRLRHGLDALDRLFRPDGTVVSVVSPDGGTSDDRFDLYDHAFVLFGMAGAAGVNERRDELADRAGMMRQRIRDGWSNPDGGFEQSAPRTLPLRANPHMHLLEAALAWQEVSPDRQWVLFADEIAELSLSRFIDPDTGALREVFDGVWRPLAGHAEDVVEPGHQFEWAWLLARWGSMNNRPDALAAARRLVHVAESEGMDFEHDLAVNALTPKLEVHDGLMRLWPQTERLKAHVQLAALAEERACADAHALAAADAARGLRRYLAHPVRGAWWEHIGGDGQPLIEHTRATSLYHITCAIETLARSMSAGGH